MADYSIWIVEYAQAMDYPVGGVLYGHHNSGSLLLPYCYGVIEGEGHLAVVDTGFDYADYGQVLGDAYGVTNWHSPDEVLGRIGINPADVDTVILTHNHYDHAGNVDAFPNAHVYLQGREVSKYMWARSLPDRLQWLTTATDPDLLLSLSLRLKNGQLTLLEDSVELMPGVTVVPAHDTHTSGSQYVLIENSHDGRWLMAGDNVYVYKNLLGTNGDGRFVPIGLAFGSIERCVLTMEDMYQYVSGEVTRIMPFHEVHMWDHFPTREFDDGLHVAEISLRPGTASRIDASAAVG